MLMRTPNPWKANSLPSVQPWRSYQPWMTYWPYGRALESECSCTINSLPEPILPSWNSPVARLDHRLPSMTWMWRLVWGCYGYWWSMQWSWRVSWRKDLQPHPPNPGRVSNLTLCVYMYMYSWQSIESTCTINCEYMYFVVKIIFSDSLAYENI